MKHLWNNILDVKIVPHNLYFKKNQIKFLYIITKNNRKINIKINVISVNHLSKVKVSWNVINVLTIILLVIKSIKLNVKFVIHSYAINVIIIQNYFNKMNNDVSIIQQQIFKDIVIYH